MSGIMEAAASGMNAQATKLSAISDNIANSDTTGYKAASVEFSSMMEEPPGAVSYTARGVSPALRYSIDNQGNLKGTSSPTDLSVRGKGFFIVSDSNNVLYLTRAGSFVPDSSGRLVNAAGYYLMGYDQAAINAGLIGNSTASLSVVTTGPSSLSSVPSTAGSLSVNLPVTDPVTSAANLPSANAVTSTFSGKTSIVAYDNTGSAITLDVYTAKTAANTWEVSVYNHADAAATGGFPYSSSALVSQTLQFDPSTGQFLSGTPTSLNIPVPNGRNITLDMGGTTELAAPFTVNSIAMDGNSPSGVDHIEVDAEGTLYSIYKNGNKLPTYTIPLGDVRSPDNMATMIGTVFAPTAASGNIIVNFAGEAGLGKIVPFSLESSTVDLANQLTDLVASQRAYAANSKSFQAGSDVLNILVNLK